jgi:DNA-binding transcriptional LysR family regulator
VNCTFGNIRGWRSVNGTVEVKDLRYFVAVYETLNFSRAASRLRTVQSNVSARIRMLEEQLRVALFERTPRSVVPTRRGRALYRPARRIIAAISALERNARGNHKRARPSRG